MPSASLRDAFSLFRNDPAVSRPNCLWFRVIFQEILELRTIFGYLSAQLRRRGSWNVENRSAPASVQRERHSA